MTRTTTLMVTAACLVAAGGLLGCSDDGAGDEDNGVAEEGFDSIQSELRGGWTASTDMALSLRFPVYRRSNNQQYGYAYCTGVALSPHWILTSAHCLDYIWNGVEVVANQRGSIYRNNSGSAQKIYDNGAWQARIPASWDAWDQEVGLDFGLIRLLDGALTTYPMWGRIIDEGHHNLWDFMNSGLYVSGFGYGSASETSCSLSLLPRTGVLARWYYGISEVGGYQNFGDTICVGDSGGPWYQHVGSRYLMFGLTSRGTNVTTDCSDQCIGSGETVRAANIAQRIDWIESATANGGLPLDCRLYAVYNSGNQKYYYYHLCQE